MGRIFEDLGNQQLRVCALEPSLPELCARYGDRGNDRVYEGVHEVKGKWLDLCLEDNLG